MTPMMILAWEIEFLLFGKDKDTIISQLAMLQTDKQM
jgi:hypothetical protein